MRYPLMRRLIQRHILVFMFNKLVHLFRCSFLDDYYRSFFFLIADVFKPNLNFLDDEKAYEDLKKRILDDESSEDEEGSDVVSDDEEEEESEEDETEEMKIKDETETNLVNLRRTIYLTIMSSVDFEEAGHKLLKIKLEPGQEVSYALYGLCLRSTFPLEGIIASIGLCC